MLPERAALRLTTADFSDLKTIAAALDGNASDPSPWNRASVSRCLRTALRMTAEAARSGTLNARGL